MRPLKTVGKTDKSKSKYNKVPCQQGLLAEVSIKIPDGSQRQRTKEYKFGNNFISNSKNPDCSLSEATTRRDVAAPCPEGINIAAKYQNKGCGGYPAKQNEF